MKMAMRALILPALLLASCVGSTAASPTRTPTVAPATAATTPTPTATPPPTTTPSPLATVASPPPGIAASDCTSTTATTRQVVERLFALSTSNDARAVSDCYAQSYRDKNANFAESAAMWSRDGPATNLVITFIDTVNGCDRFRVTAQMPSTSWWMKGQTGGQGFFSVGPESGRPRIHDGGTAIAIASLTTVRCG